MIVIDSDVFVRDLRYPGDVRHSLNHRFLAAVSAHSEEAATTLFNVLEVCGVLSFNLNRQQLLALYASFGRQYGLTVLAPALPDRVGRRMIDLLAGRAFGVILRRVAFKDALPLLTAESHPTATTFVTWNAKHFLGKTRLDVMTPEQWLMKRSRA
ncbi:MAG: hypothetical protein GW911_27895 [Armatimonadetes bacterium]|nr:hypothetical protein [Armatimonadota bacterium]NCO95259.1 hypothetical protein [Armatimonadota bacterium]NCP33606.1 hypothetical protein [Armatimonadota bacterium]NCQ29276.1 hypothetical protein [Armatimonadota bacterium]NDK15872.1 hypothetical protein [Armatimonadota bacterium]